MRPGAAFVRVLDHPAEARRLAIIRRSDGLFTYAEYVRRPVLLDEATGDILDWEWEVGIDPVGWIPDRDAEGHATGNVWFEWSRSQGGLFGTAEEAEACAVMAIPGYRSIN